MASATGERSDGLDAAARTGRRQTQPAEYSSSKGMVMNLFYLFLWIVVAPLVFMGFAKPVMSD